MEFFNKLGEMARVATEKAGDSLEINKINSDIGIEKGNIQGFHREIGEYFWAKFVTGEKLDDEVMFICDKIVVTQDKIKNLEGMVDKIKTNRELLQAEREELKRIRREAEERQKAETAAAEVAAAEMAQAAEPTPAEPTSAETAEPVQAKSVQAKSVDVTFCGNCGGALKSERFCPFCGQEAGK